MNDFIDNLKRQAEENPIAALAVGAGLLTAVTKLLSAGNDSRNSKAWAKEVERRIKKSQS